MLNSEISLNSANFPKGFRRDFDAHIYYEPSSREEAVRLREAALLAFANQPVFVGKLIDSHVGPHTLSMFEINFPKELLGEIKRWLSPNRGSLSVLVHEVTGDDFRDHSVGAVWLGPPLPLDGSKFDPISRSGLCSPAGDANSKTPVF